MQSIRLKKDEERRLKQGHLWIFSNEINTKETPLSNFEAGESVIVEASNGKPLGTGYINPNALICVRLVNRDVNYPLSKSLLVHRFKQALSLRERVFDEPFYRLVHGEGDFLPGLVIDRFNDVFSVQITTAGMERHKNDVIEALEKVFQPSGIVFRNDCASRAAEMLPNEIEIVGDVPDYVPLMENGVQFEAPVKDGQKTGWFYDHRMSRERLQHYVEGKRVLDVFSYIGGWGVQAAVAGASEVYCTDASEFALDGVMRNAELNGVIDKMVAVEGNAFEVLTELRNQREQFDVVICDPPAFIKRKKDFKNGKEAYRRINQLAMRLLGADGVLVSASCSHHMPRDTLLQTLNQSARHIDRTIQMIEEGHQGPDHPVNPAIPETLYLKTFFARVYRG